MAETQRHAEADAQHSGVSPVVLNLLETLDNVAHVIVAIFFIILAGSVLIYASLLLVRDMPLMVQSPHPVVAERTVPGERAAPSGSSRGEHVVPTEPATRDHATPNESAPGGHDATVEPHITEEPAAEKGSSLFLHRSLELLSTLLFVVIVLELLKTIITYLKTHNIQAIMKEFLVVGIISSIRKILLVGAESSLGSADPTAAYIKEAGGTVITIAGILLLIAGLIFLQRTENGYRSA